VDSAYPDLPDLGTRHGPWRDTAYGTYYNVPVRSIDLHANTVSLPAVTPSPYRYKMTIKAEKKDEEVAGVANAGNSNAEKEFPDALYCPLTKQIMKDPVVDPDGDSFERSAVTARDQRDQITGLIYYPNRALKAIIDEEVQRREEEGSIRGGLRRFEKSLRSGFEMLVERSPIPSGEYRPLPDSFYCPITLDLIHKPVIDPDGNTFERGAITNWIRVNSKSPVTRNTLSVSQLRNNEALYELMEEEKGKTDESIHPSIRRWKDTPAATQGREVQGENENDLNNGYPTTQAEINARRRGQACSILGIIFLVPLVLYFPPLIILLLCISACINVCTREQDE
jgi:hypothetical protein